MEVLGIDIGGSGIKGATVNTATGELTAKRYKIATPEESTPENVARVVREVAEHFSWSGPIGCTFPAVVQQGIVYTAANVDPRWIGAHGQELMQEATGSPVILLNDADAAGIAEMTFGVGQGRAGTVLMLTFGTGIGSSIFIDGHLFPNTELGHLLIRGKDAEHRASSRVREEKNLSWKRWTRHVNEYLAYVESLLWPDLIIFGGGISRDHKEFFHLLHTRAELKPAEFFNEAGIVGAAMAAAIGRAPE